MAHAGNIVRPVPDAGVGVGMGVGVGVGAARHYRLDRPAVKQFETAVRAALTPPAAAALHVSHWPVDTTRQFVRATVFGFLRGDLYTAATEFMARAEVSAGLPGYACRLLPSRHDKPSPLRYPSLTSCPCPACPTYALQQGSFGLQIHSTYEPGAVVITSKGQPMSLSFSPHVPLCLFASEAEALAVPVDAKVCL